MDNNQSDVSIGWKKLMAHFRDFPYIWVLILLLLLTAIISYCCPALWRAAIWISGISLCLLTMLLLTKPMNAVYGLIGTTGSIKLFFLNFLIITFVFAVIYHLGFFKNAGITYDVNQPHIDYKMFAMNSDKSDSIKTNIVRDTLFFERQLDSIVYTESVVHVSTNELKYQKLSLAYVWRNTILTTLMQDPTDLFTIASTYNQAMESDNASLDKQKCGLFQWILIFQILISWIFFGVFIALLYDKFRHES